MQRIQILNSEYFTLGNLFQSIPIFWRVLWMIRDSDTIHNTSLHILLCCQDPVSVPESLCEVEDWNTNTSSSCNNDNYDSNKSECLPLQSPILVTWVLTPLALSPQVTGPPQGAVCSLTGPTCWTGALPCARSRAGAPQRTTDLSKVNKGHSKELL